MKKVFYEKVGRKYRPVSEYDSDLVDALPKGNHLIMSYPGGKSTRYNVDPALAPMIAAGRYAEDAISKAIHDASEVRRRDKGQRCLTNEQHEAWLNLVDKLGEDAKMLEWASVREVAEVGVKAMQEEADKLLANPAVRKSYERFMFVCKLAMEDQNGA